MTIYQRNTINQFVGSWNSGIASLQFENGDSVHCENAPTARALIGAFGADGIDHSIDNDSLRGESIVWAYDDMGLIMAGFLPYREWLDAGHPKLADGESVELSADR